MSLENKRRIALLTLASFPQGNVSTLRYSSYLRALAKIGYESYVIVYSPTNMAKNQLSRSGTENGICYQYATKPSWKSGSILEKCLFLLVGLFKSVLYLVKFKPSVIVLYGDNPFFVTLFYWFVSRVMRVRYIGDRSELPSLKERSSKALLAIYEKKQRFFDGMIIMTKQLCNYYSRFSKKSDFVFFMPMTIDVNRFSTVVPSKKNYIAVVFGTHNRDGLADSIRCYSRYVNELNGKYNLLLIGKYNNMPNKDELDSLISKSGLSDRIHINGPASLEEVPQLLADASCLMTTPTTYVSGGFPTKLGEYMLSGTPVVATIAGELLDYIEPGKDMLMCYPKEMSKVADHLKYLEDHESEGREIAANAQKKAQYFFNAETYVQDLCDFFSI